MSRKSGSIHQAKNRSSVDESLFGDTTANKIRKQKQNDTSIVTQDLVSSLRTVQPPPKPVVSSPPVMLRSEELSKIHHTVEATDFLTRKNDVSRLVNERRVVAEQRKEKIRALEEQRIAHLPKSAEEIAEEEERAHRLALAAALREDSNGDMKKMNSIRNYAITVSIRNRQLEDKRRLQEAARLAERMAELQADVEALQARKKAEAAEAARAKEREVLRQQLLEQAEASRAAKAAARTQERQEQAAYKQKLDEAVSAESRALLERKERARAEQKQFLEETSTMLSAKAQYRAREIAAERAADLAFLEREKQKAKLLEEQEAERKRKEARDFQVRANVARVLEDTSRRDEMLARRAYEQGLRAERAQALERARRAQKEREDLKRAKDESMEQKQRARVAAIAAERTEYLRADAARKEFLEEAEREEAERVKKNREWVLETKQHIDLKEEKKKEEFLDRRKELEKDQQRQKDEIQFLRNARDKKLAEMRQIGIPETFLAELINYDPERDLLKL